MPRPSRQGKCQQEFFRKPARPRILGSLMAHTFGKVSGGASRNPCEPIKGASKCCKNST